ncbi:NAD-dependent epimerase/dehydratase family protein [Ramlibacter sp. PS4R-6]|uniref:NAD-dependent epimerase/dehydratase family protein n=1 Tax=Ramlibacter sp. PS4R-6 TaxID=3133438 RepID=UPI0030B61030
MKGAVVVTGATGFIGRGLVARLAGEGRALVALGRRELEARDGSLERAFDGAGCVVHLAARAHRAGSAADFEADVALTRSLARIAKQGGVRRFVHVSSVGVLGTRTRGTAFTEATPPAPREPYAHAKWHAEQALQGELAAGATEWTILRPSMVYGPHAPGNFARLVRAVQRGWPLPLAGVRNRRQLLALDNLVDAIVCGADHPDAARRTFLVADAEPVSTPELVALIAQGLGASARLWPLPATMLEAAARATGRGRMADSLLGDLEIDCNALRSLGWQPRVAPREGIVQAAAASRP